MKARTRTALLGLAFALTALTAGAAPAETAAAAKALPATPKIAPPKIEFEKVVLGNGLNVILHEDHSTPIVAVNLWYHVGSKNEKKGKTGFAHLFEHMMFQGSQHHDKDFIESMEPIGATDLNGTTDFDRTNYFENVPPTALEHTLWLESDRLGFLLPAMTQERLDNQREVVKNERRQGVDNQPYGLVDERMYAALYPSHHPYSWDVIGYMDDLTAASKGDVEGFFKEYYTPNNCTLVVAGDIDKANVKALVEKYFGSLPAGPPVYRMEGFIPELSREVRLTMEDRVPLPRLYIAWHMPGYFQPGEADLTVLSGILSQGKTSRLYKRLVYDLKIAQDVAAAVDGREIGSLFRVQVTAKEGHTLAEIEPIVREEIEKLRTTPPAAGEVERVVTGMLAGFTRGLERIGGFNGKSDRLGMYNTYLGDPGYLEKDFARYQAVTPASVQAAARRWLHDGKVVMTVEPFADMVAAKDAAGLKRDASPGIGQAPALKLPEFQRAKLSNGLEVVLAESHKVPLVQLNLIVRGGWSADAKEKLGIASFMARMQDEGTAKRTALQISDEMQDLGAQLGTNSNIDVCQVTLNALKARLDSSLDLWSDVVLNPAFPEAEIERQRLQVLGQILQEKKQPVGMGIRILPVLLYGADHPYGQPLTGTGTEDSVKAIRRDDLVKYHATWFRPNNATLVVVGDTTLAEITPKLEKALGTWKAGEVPKIDVPVRPQPAATKVYIVDKPGAAQSVILAGHLMAPKADPSSVPFEVLNTVLGGQFSARINMNLREGKGYTYGAYSIPLDARGQGMYLLYAPVRSDVTKESLSELMKEVSDIRGTRPVTADELGKAIDSLTLSLPGQHETMQAIAAKIADVVVYGLPADYWSTYSQKVRAQNPESLTAIAKSAVLPDHLVVVVVGDRAAIEPGIRSLNLGPIEYLDASGQPVVVQAEK
jgi:zinc protease